MESAQAAAKTIAKDRLQAGLFVAGYRPCRREDLTEVCEISCAEITAAIQHIGCERSFLAEQSI